MAEETAADQTQTPEAGAGEASSRRIEPREIALMVGVAVMVVGTAASATSPMAGFIAAAAMAGLTLYLPHGELD